MNPKKVVCYKMNKILSQWKSYLSNVAFSEDWSQLKGVVDSLDQQNIYFADLFRSTSPVLFFNKFIDVPEGFPSYRNYVVFLLSYDVLYVINLDTLEKTVVTNEMYKNLCKISAEILNGDLFTYGKCYTTQHKHETANITNPIVKNVYNFIATNNTATRNVYLKSTAYGDTIVYFKIFYYI